MRAQEVYDGLVAREKRLREAEAALAGAEAEGLRRLRARETGIDADAREREAALKEQVRSLMSSTSRPLVFTAK